MTMRYEARQAWRSQWAEIAGTGLLLVVSIVAFVVAARPELQVIAELLFVGFVVAAVAVAYRHYQWRYTIDDVNIESSRGILGRDVRSIRIKDLRNINLHQSLFQRLLNIGELGFSSAGGGGIEVVFHGIVDPVNAKRHVQQLFEQTETPQRGQDTQQPRCQ